ncbi:unnamed protein product [Cyberlindnera jadinii]|uniref:Mediator of RNA polymerase II transcription subunit 21 n=1 Tax=Cyberlindnera jadinii (strain ATCC 18201 / CBS 1600 / BCRC 20928 / JCM 3617 / NBRC 0987 / NRRL Y-1542) TaxID=983966 RepID=A0A0H5C9U3_CYBJN|nr:CSE2-domain-containing protein [Cyberlindnera jadinii NRRL Y-1542]ODV71321.1 CSE2-domain-containing protein [Cyberlindnera jadinii NRRL Y-1542]CEP24847.1 unnamed protein product [Cyberlindnera jadinii]
MADRLTQLQICLDQLVEQFCATLHYVDTHHEFIPAEGEEAMTDPQATVATKEEFKDTIDELSTDLILKTRQIFALIDSLPGAGVSQQEQIKKVVDLQKELESVEEEKLQAVRQKDELLAWCNDLVTSFSKELIESKKMA